MLRSKSFANAVRYAEYQAEERVKLHQMVQTRVPRDGTPVFSNFKWIAAGAKGADKPIANLNDPNGAIDTRNY